MAASPGALCSASNARGNVELTEWVCLLSPVSSGFAFEPSVRRAPGGPPSLLPAWAVAAAGLAASALLAALAVTTAGDSAHATLRVSVTAGTLAALLGAAASDGAELAAWLCARLRRGGSAPSLVACALRFTLRCGNFGTLLCASAAATLDAVAVLERMAEARLATLSSLSFLPPRPRR